MNSSVKTAIETAISHSFIQGDLPVSEEFIPSLLTNNYKNGQKVLTTLEKQLLECDAFEFSVAFITVSGVEPLLMTFKELERKEVPGRILTTDYLTFSEPEALRKLASLKNLEVRMYQAEEEGFHTKGYIFHKDESIRMVIGSSNMTLNALTRSEEWNAGLVSMKEGSFAEEVSENFEKLWESVHSRPVDEIIDSYEQKYKIVQEQKRVAAQRTPVKYQEYTLSPNPMQVQFTQEIENLIQKGEDRALLISATGTGKTYASAFALRQIKPKRALFLVHREQILRQAKQSYERVLGSNHTYGLVSGTSHEMDCDYTFGTVQTFSREGFLNSIKPDEYDVIVIDEVHHAGAETYQRIMNHFKPKFWLGMTASPERNDGYDIFEAFHHNIAGEIRLQQALEEDYLAPFHYFGLSDLVVKTDNETVEYNAADGAFRDIEVDERVDHVMEQANYYGYSGDRVKGLIFVSTNKEAERLSKKFNERGWRTASLSGMNSQEEREMAIRRLTGENGPDALDYLITVDIFNEGVDIPDVNQVIMLRPTQSAIVFVQQLGRGLRKAKDKEFVVVLDFIGNYDSNYLIPIALSGDQSYNKDNMRRFVQEGTRLIPGASTIHFDEIARKRIFEAVDQAKTNSVALLRESYTQLKFKLGHIPRLTDFDKYESIDPNLFFQNSNLGSYQAFLMKYEKEYEPRFNKDELLYLKYLSNRFGEGKWIDELLIIKQLMINPNFEEHQWEKELTDQGVRVSENTMPVLKNSLSGRYAVGTGAVNLNKIKFTDYETGKIDPKFSKMLEHKEFANAVEEVIDFSEARNQKNFSDTYEDTKLKLNAKYTYEEVCRLLEWEMPAVPQNIGGYWIDKKTKTYPVFINYDKKEDVAEHLRYHDRFLSPNRLRAMSKNGRTHNSDDMSTALHADELKFGMHLFIRKNKDDKMSKEFYYLGKIHSTGWYEEQKNMKNQNVVEIEYELQNPVRDDLYDYFTND